MPDILSSMEREIEAVASEFDMNQQHDGARRQQLWSHLAKKDHPLNGFGWGNRQSLSEETAKVRKFDTQNNGRFFLPSSLISLKAMFMTGYVFDV